MFYAEAQENVAWVPKMVNLLLGFERSRAAENEKRLLQP